MRNAAHSITETLISLVVFSVVTLGIAGISYQIFSPNGQLQRWISDVWEFNPLLIIVLGGTFLLVKRWLEALNPAQKLADLMIYGAIMSGLFILFKVFIGG